MSCCEGCNEKVELETRQATIRFDTNGSANPGLIGKNLKLVTGTLFDRNGGMPKGGFRVEMVTTGEKHRISIYRMCLPFDELLLILQFDETVGEVQVRQYGLIEPLVQLHLELTREVVEAKLYQELAPMMYRVPNRVAFHQLVDKHKLAGVALEKANVKLVNNDRRENWPMLIIFHTQGEGAITTRNAAVVNIPNWKNNADWQ